MTQNSYVVFIAEYECEIWDESPSTTYSPDILRELVVQNDYIDTNYDRVPDGLHSYAIEASDSHEAISLALSSAFVDEVPSQGSIWCAVNTSLKVG